MAERDAKQYLFASDFDQTLTFNDSGYVLSEILGIPTEEFKRKATGMANLHLVQQGAELAYLLLHDPEFRSRVRREHLYEVGKRIRLKENIGLLYEILDHGIEGYHFDFYIFSAAPVEVIQSALEGIVPADHIYGTEFSYKASGEIDTIRRARAGYGKVAVLDDLRNTLQVPPDHIIYAGDGSSDIHVMLHVNALDRRPSMWPKLLSEPCWAMKQSAYLCPFWRKLSAGSVLRSASSLSRMGSASRNGSGCRRTG